MSQPAKKGTQESAKSTTKKAAKTAAARPGPGADKADGESTVLAKIAEIPASHAAADHPWQEAGAQ